MSFIIKGSCVLGVVLLFSSVGNAATTQTVNAVAQIESIANLDVSIFEGQNVCGRDGSCNSVPTGPSLGTTMNFGPLTEMAGSPWHTPLGSDKYFLVYLGTNTSSRPYTIKATMSRFNNGVVDLPRAASAAVIYVSDGASDIAGDSYSSNPVSAAMNAQTVYTSNASGGPAVVQMLYAIPKTGSAAFPGAELIPPSQQGGTYTASLTFSLVIS